MDIIFPSLRSLDPGPTLGSIITGSAMTWLITAVVIVGITFAIGRTIDIKLLRELESTKVRTTVLAVISMIATMLIVIAAMLVARSAIGKIPEVGKTNIDAPFAATRYGAVHDDARLRVFDPSLEPVLEPYMDHDIALKIRSGINADLSLIEQTTDENTGAKVILSCTARVTFPEDPTVAVIDDAARDKLISCLTATF